MAHTKGCEEYEKKGMYVLEVIFGICLHGRGSYSQRSNAARLVEGL